MNPVVRSGVRAIRLAARPGSKVEQQLRRNYNRFKSHRVVRRADSTHVQLGGQNFMHVEARRPDDSRVGILLRGGCDLPTLFRTVPMLKPRVRGRLCMYKQGNGISDSRADLLLQSLHGVPHDHVAEVCERLELPPSYFAPDLFAPSFKVPGAPRLGTFPTSVVALSMGPNLVRTMYRHREHGFLLDPGGWWLNQSMDQVLGNLDRASWFGRTFERIGKLEVDEFVEHFGLLVKEIKSRTGAHVLVLNVLDLEPGNLTHNYSLVTNQHLCRLRQFALALTDLSGEHDFHIIDVSRVVKGEGAGRQIDFAHFPTELMDPVADSAFRVLDGLGIV